MFLLQTTAIGTTARISNRADRCLVFFLVMAFLAAGGAVKAQYLGVTCGWQYSAQLTGPVTDPDQFNISAYNPDPSNPNATWDNWADQLGQAGVDFVCPNCTGSWPNTNNPPSQMAPLLTALRNRGLANRIKFAIFDDNAASWVAQWNMANGRGYGYAEKFDMSDTNNWKYLYDYNYKIFYQTIPDTNRFKINGRPVITIWTGNEATFLTNMQGNASQALMYVRQCCERDFGFNPYIILSQDFFSNDTTCNNPGVADASEGWFVAGPTGPSYTLTPKNGVSIGVAIAEFQHTGQSGFLDPNHGQLFETGLTSTVGAGALFTLCEGFTDYEEDAAMWRVRNLDTNGNSLSYSQTLYDYPNQRIDMLRQYSGNPFPVELKLEAEGCDYFSGGSYRPGYTNYYRNGSIYIEPTTDVGGGWDIGGINAGQWMEWESVPIQGDNVHLQVRVSSPSAGGSLHFVIDGVTYPTMTVPVTGGWQTWTTIDSGTAYAFAKGTTHVVRLVCETGGFNVNYLLIHDEIPLGATISLQSLANNLWVSTGNAGTSALTASNTVHGAAESFVVVDSSSSYGYGCVALQALANNLYVTADTNGTAPLIANAASVGPAQLFLWVDNGDGSIALRALANHQVVGVGSSPYPLVNNNFTVGTAQSFNYVISQPSTNLPAPTGLGAVPGNQQVILSWNESVAVTSYNVKRSLTWNGPFVTIATNVTTMVYTDTGLATGTPYYYVVSAVNGSQISLESTPLMAMAIVNPSQASVAFTSGVFTSNSVLALAGTVGAYGVGFGDSALQTTANGYVFHGDPLASITYNAGGNSTGFLATGGTSGDAAFDAVLNNCETGGGSSLMVLNNLTIGDTYNVLFLAADTRGGATAGSQFSIIAGADATTSPTQTYAFADGLPSLGGYVLGTFTATTASECFFVNNTNGSQINAVLVVNSGVPDTFTNGTFLNNSVLNLMGSPSQELYGVSCGDAVSRTTANGYAFGSYPGHISYGSGGYGTSGFLSGATSGDAGFNSVLNNAELGIGNGILTLSNLTAGTTYNALFLEADTRGVGNRSFSMTAGTTSPSQSYAYTNGSPYLGGYILATFTATNNTQLFTNNAVAYGYQLNGVLVGKTVNSASQQIPLINSMSVLNGTNLVVSGVYGPVGGFFQILTSTNLAAPISSWTSAGMGFFDISGNCNFTQAVNAAESAGFYRLALP